MLGGDAVAVDLGANCGVYTRRFLECLAEAGRVRAFEPNPTYLPFLGRRAIDEPRLVMNAAVSDRNGSMVLTVRRIEGGSPEPALTAVSSEGTPDGFTVQSLALDHALRDVLRLDPLKIDIEGGEFSALRGAFALIRRYRPILIIETLFLNQLSMLLDEMGLAYRCDDGKDLQLLANARPRSDATYVLRS